MSGIEASHEFRQTEIESLYQHYLGRAADPAGLDFFTAELASGGTVEKVAASLAGSPEFLASHGGTNAAAIDAMFAAILGRSVNVPSQTYFEQALAAGETRQQIAAQIFASNEYQQHVAGGWLVKYLGRQADPAGVGHFAADLRAGATDEQAVSEILSSDEYFAHTT